MSDLIVTVIVAIAMVVGLAGTVLPILPGLWLMWAAAVVYGLTAGLSTVGWVALGFITVLAVVGTATALILPQRSASGGGVAWWGQLLAGVLAVVGFFVIPVIGAAVGFVLGVFVTAAIRTAGLRSAIPATWAVVRSLVMASGAQLVSGLLMLIVWVLWVVAG